MGSTLWPLQTFDPQAEFTIVERRLPHWSQAGCLCFITWRTVDSIPQSVLNRWHADREAWLRRHGIEPQQGNWKAQLLQLDHRLRAEFVQTFSERWHRHLDACHGACALRDSSLSQIVADSLHKFDGERYLLTDFVVMPNHVHLLAAFADEDGMLAQCDSWKHFTARELNQRLGNTGRFWQQDWVRPSGAHGGALRSIPAIHRQQSRQGATQTWRVGSLLQGLEPRVVASPLVALSLRER